MALPSDDLDIRPARLWIDMGGNGDWYVNILEKKTQFDQHGNLQDNMNVISSVRVGTCFSGGRAPSEVRIAVANLARALENAGLNQHPYHDPSEEEFLN